MEQFLRQRRLSELMDAAGMSVLIYALATIWFVWLWGLSVPALLAGAALGTLGQMGRVQYRRRTLARREKTLRSRIGGELLLEDMLLSPAENAHCQAAALLQSRWPLELVKADADGALCRLGTETLLIQCLRTPPEGEMSAGDLAAGQRAVRAAGADRGVLCALGGIPAKIAARAEQTAVPLRLVRRETLLTLAARQAPATDEQLVALGKRRRRPGGTGTAAALIFRRDKAARYFLYGLVMLGLYILSGAGLYAVTGMICLTMAVFCRRSTSGEEPL